jgi:hypothetical protein
MSVWDTLQRGVVIPAHPLALNAQRKLDERRQRALTRYYIAAGAGGLAVGVHTTQFAIRDEKVGLYRPVLELAAEEIRRANASRIEPLIRIAGLCGDTDQAIGEARIASELGYQAGLLSLAALDAANEDTLIAHCQAVSEVIPIIGFYLQAAVGGRVLPYSFWRRLAEIPGLVAVKMAPFNRYHTLDVIRAIADAGRGDVALYTGNDDNIVMDLLTPYRLEVNGQRVERRIVGGLLGHWAVWTQGAVEILHLCHAAAENGQISPALLALNIEVTDANAAIFDVSNQFAGCIAGLHEVLRRQGLLEGVWCLDENETLGPGQAAEIDRVYAAYPHLNDDVFVAEHRDEWLAG